MMMTDLDALEANIAALQIDDPNRSLTDYARIMSDVVVGATALIAEVRALRADLADLKRPLPVIVAER